MIFLMLVMICPSFIHRTLFASETWPLMLFFLIFLIPIVMQFAATVGNEAAGKTFEKIAAKFEYENCLNEKGRLEDYIKKSNFIPSYERLTIFDVIKKTDISENYYLINLQTWYRAPRGEHINYYVIFHIESDLGITQEICIERKTHLVQFSQRLLGSGGSSGKEVIPGFEDKFFAFTTATTKLYSVLTADLQAFLLKNSDMYPLTGWGSISTKIIIKGSGIDFICSHSAKREDMENLMDLGNKMVYMIRELMAEEEKVGEKDEKGEEDDFREKDRRDDEKSE